MKKEDVQEETITVSKKEHGYLLDRNLWLTCLESAGVDNWDGIDEAYNLKEEWEKEGNQE